MSYSFEIEVPLNTVARPAFNYPIEFQAVDKYLNPIPLSFLSGASGFCIEVISGSNYVMWRDCISGNFTLNNSGLGLFEWNVQQNFFDQLGVFETKVWIKMSGMRSFPLDDLRTSVTGRP